MPLCDEVVRLGVMSNHVVRSTACRQVLGIPGCLSNIELTYERYGRDIAGKVYLKSRCKLTAGCVPVLVLSSVSLSEYNCWQPPLSSIYLDLVILFLTPPYGSNRTPNSFQL